jgi:hypothetical protein
LNPEPFALESDALPLRQSTFNAFFMVTDCAICWFQLQESSKPAKKVCNVQEEIGGLGQDELIPFLVDKLVTAGFADQLHWLQDQLLEAAYVRLGQCW